MSRLKHIFLLLIIGISTFTANASFYGKIIPCIKPFAVEIHTINEVVGDTDHAKLDEENGYVIIPNTFYKHDGNSKGILIVHDWADVYMAYDLICPYCTDHKQEGTMYMATSIFAWCDTCGVRAEMMFNVGSGQLTGHPFEHGQVWQLIPYIIEESERDDMLFLILFPNPMNNHKL